MRRPASGGRYRAGRCRARRVVPKRPMRAFRSDDMSSSITAGFNPSACRVVYDASASLFDNWWAPCVGLVFVAIGIAMVRHPGFLRGSKEFVRTFGMLYAGFAVVWTVVAASVVFRDSVGTARALWQGQFQRVEGTVTHFVPGEPGGHGDERWEVVSGGRVFRYDYAQYVMGPGYHRTAPYGGEVRDGLHVRVADVDGAIARLEVCP